MVSSLSCEAYFPADHHYTAIAGPCQREPLTPNRDCSCTGLAPDIPEFARAVTGNRSQLSFFRRIPCYSLNTACVASQLCAVLDLRFVWVPDAKRSVCRAGSNEIPCRIPGYCANTVKVSQTLSTQGGDRVTCVCDPGPRVAGS